MKPGDRVRFNQYCPWPERVGCEGVIVENRSTTIYPQPAASEVIVLLDADPLIIDDEFVYHAWWTCVASKRSLDVI